MNSKPTLVKTTPADGQLFLSSETDWRPPANVRSIPIPYNIAFREVLDFVTKILDEAGEQWGDQAKQDTVSTILIAASKQRFLTLWERNAA